jgi:hypothetical protein
MKSAENGSHTWVCVWVWRIIVFLGLSAPAAVCADLADELRDFKGYTIADVKTVAGYIDGNGKRSEDFEGCDFDRTIVFDDDSTLVCSTYRYHYAYRPKAVILLQAANLGGQRYATVVMIVGDESYSMRGFLLK